MKINPAYEIRVQRINETPGRYLVDSLDVAAYWRHTIKNMSWHFEDREVCVVMMVNTRLRAVGHSLVSLGTLNESIVHPREVFRPAMALNAYGVVLAHNHPSGNSEPSKADLSVTERMRVCGQLLGIKMIDHVIIGKGEVYSIVGEQKLKCRAA